MEALKNNEVPPSFSRRELIHLTVAEMKKVEFAFDMCMVYGT